MGDIIRNGAGIPNRLLHFRAGVLQPGYYLGVPIPGSAVQKSAGPLLGLRHVHRTTASESRSYRVHAVRRFEHRNWHPVLGLHFWHHPRQHYIHHTGKWPTISIPHSKTIELLAQFHLLAQFNFPRYFITCAKAYYTHYNNFYYSS